MEIIYGGEVGYFSSLRTEDGNSPILNLEQGRLGAWLGRMIFYIADVDAIWAYLLEKGFHPESPRGRFMGERYFHMPALFTHHASCRNGCANDGSCPFRIGHMKISLTPEASRGLSG